MFVEYTQMCTTLQRCFNRNLKKLMPKEVADGSDEEYVTNRDKTQPPSFSSFVSSRPKRAASSRAREALHIASGEFDVSYHKSTLQLNPFPTWSICP